MIAYDSIISWLYHDAVSLGFAATQELLKTVISPVISSPDLMLFECLDGTIGQQSRGHWRCADGVLLKAIDLETTTTTTTS